MLTHLFNSALLMLAVVAGGVFVIALNALDQRRIVKILLAFSGGFLLAMAFAHFLPELYMAQQAHIGIYVLLGFLIQLFLEYFSGGIEHGHVHHHGQATIPWTLLVSLSVHSFLEGIPLAHPEIVHHAHHAETNSLLFGIVLHQIPVAIALMTLLRHGGNTIGKSWMLLLLFGIMTPAGLWFGVSFQGHISMEVMNALLAIVIGMFLHISTTIIFETSENHKFNLLIFVAGSLFGRPFLC